MSVVAIGAPPAVDTSSNMSSRHAIGTSLRGNWATGGWLPSMTIASSSTRKDCGGLLGLGEWRANARCAHSSDRPISAQCGRRTCPQSAATGPYSLATSRRFPNVAFASLRYPRQTMTPGRIIKATAPPERSHECFPDVSPDAYGTGTVWECKCGTQFRVVNSVFNVGHSYWVILGNKERVDADALTVQPDANLPYAEAMSIPSREAY